MLAIACLGIAVKALQKDVGSKFAVRETKGKMTIVGVPYHNRVVPSEIRDLLVNEGYVTDNDVVGTFMFLAQDKDLRLNIN